MATKTANYGFNKPEMNDYASIETLAETLDEIDNALKNVEESIGDSEALQEHIDDVDIHVSAEEKEAWNSVKEHTHVPTEVGITYGTTDLTAGTSALETGKIYLVYE